VAVEYRILGPLELRADGRPLELTGSRQRALLTILLLRRGEVVSPDRLIDALWGGSARESANALQAVISRVRRILGAAGSPDDLETHPGGYALHVAPERIDLARFDQLRERARRAVAGGSAAEAVELLTRALGLWRGEALSEFVYEDFAAADAARLAELRLQAVEERCDAALRSGRHESVVAELQGLVRAHPDRERLWLLLMLALYRSARQAAALETYQQARAALAERAGVDPGRELRELAGRMLRQDPDLDLEPAPPRADLPPAACVVVLSVPGATASTVDVAETLAIGRRGCELLLAETLPPGADGLAAANVRLEALATGRDVPVRSAAFTTRDGAADLASLAEDEQADAVVAPLAMPGVLELLHAASCHVALVAGHDAGPRPDVVAVPFGGTSHDWAALELATWLGRAGGRLLLVGIEDAHRSGRDASRLLAVASLAVQRIAGLRVETALAADDGRALHRAVADATVVAGISERWQSEGVGGERLRLADRQSGLTLIVRAGISTGSLTVRDSLTRHPWSHPPSG
jgi:DNA-binding SARP family transcriptional activator